VTPLEQIDSSGQPVAEDARWTLHSVAARTLSLTEYLRALFSAPRGFYRVIAIVISDRPFAYGPDEAVFDELREWARAGLNVLPAPVRVRLYGESHDITVLVYEFEREEAGSRIILPGRHRVPTHLSHTRLVGYFE
jgi:hypothetical protein